MSADIGQLVEQAGPYLATAVSAYGVAVFARGEGAGVDATAGPGRRMLQAVWLRQDERGREALAAAVRDAHAAPDDADAAAAVRQQVKRALRDDVELPAELARMLPAAGETVKVTASGRRSIAAQSIGTAVTGDNATIRP
ncbi:hypothetical protein [Streptomyces caeruleatus]|uniref:Uncharacterized protein n=1 Tax=Streptomyces caeruleatus TaxID=661399 RepID=A0A101TEX0_9ACTN|nr:hypothetical protein [Streptomyces caeruleatus]KUN91132.1 hypothetical protein AQJ67_43090 [Streptomyces caeruleatus]